MAVFSSFFIRDSYRALLILYFKSPHPHSIFSIENFKKPLLSFFQFKAKISAKGAIESDIEFDIESDVENDISGRKSLLIVPLMLCRGDKAVF